MPNSASSMAVDRSFGTDSSSSRPHLSKAEKEALREIRLGTMLKDPEQERPDRIALGQGQKASSKSTSSKSSNKKKEKSA